MAVGWGWKWSLCQLRAVRPKTLSREVMNPIHRCVNWIPSGLKERRLVNCYLLKLSSEGKDFPNDPERNVGLPSVLQQLSLLRTHVPINGYLLDLPSHGKIFPSKKPTKNSWPCHLYCRIVTVTSIYKTRTLKLVNPNPKYSWARSIKSTTDCQ